MSKVLYSVVSDGFIDGIYETQSNKVENHQPVYVPVNTINDIDHHGFCRQFSNSYEESKNLMYHKVRITFDVLDEIYEPAIVSYFDFEKYENEVE